MSDRDQDRPPRHTTRSDRDSETAVGMPTSWEQAEHPSQVPLDEEGVAARDIAAAQAVAFLREHGGDAVRAALDRDPADVAEQVAKSRAEAVAAAVAASLTLTEAASALGLSRSAITYRIRKRRLYSFTVDRRRYLPRWQFQPVDSADGADTDGRLEPIPGLATVVPAIDQAEHPLGVHNFMTTPLVDFEAGSPVGHLRAGGDPALVAEWFESMYCC